ncbi:MAG: YjjW family glycine radical enzyme activase [Lachnospiraceae bacterium]|nr:YjjW family glycine radical enzyme activase [Lachnospiraceae bacterium]
MRKESGDSVVSCSAWTGGKEDIGKEMRAPVNKIIPFSAVDGYGNRTAVFFQGCNQNCLYCHNPETIQECIHCGACVTTCPAGALSLSDAGRVVYDISKCCNCDTCLKTCTNNASPRIRHMTSKELLEEIRAYLPFIDGVTASGGECSLRSDFLTEFFERIKKEKKTAYMDTNGQIPLWDKKELLAVLDKTMIDLKAGTEEDHRKLTGMGLENPVENIRRMAAIGKLYEIRTVVVPDVVDNARTVALGASLIADVPDVRYKLIKFRHYGVRSEYAGIKEPSDAVMEELRELAAAKGVKNIVVT